MPQAKPKKSAPARNGKTATLHRQTLVRVNVSVYTARRDTAHERVVEVLRQRLDTPDKERRLALYGLCAYLIEEAIQSTRRSLVQEDAPVLHYLRIMRDTVAASSAMVNHEITLTRESVALQEVIDPYVLTQLQNASQVFGNSEMSILGCLEELLKFGQPIIQQDTEERLATFSDDDRRRYEVALHEFQNAYRQREQDTLQPFVAPPAPAAA